MKSKTEIQGLRGKSKEELFKELTDAQKKLTELQIGQSFRKLKNYREIKNTRKKVARIWTILAEKILAEQSIKES